MTTTPTRIDLNLDFGEGFGAWSKDVDEDALLRLASSVNLACGFHAGDPSRMRNAVEAAKLLGVAVGAHPGTPDLLGFGRRQLVLSPSEVKDYVTYQIGALQGFLSAADMPIHHVKLHGQLAKQCNTEPAAAAAFVEAVRSVNNEVPIYVNRRSEIWTAATRLGVPTAAEFHADMPLRRDGTRVPPPGDQRNGRDPFSTPETVRARVCDLLTSGAVDAYDGGRVEVVAQTISIHTDDPDAIDMTNAVRAGIADAGFELSSQLVLAGSVPLPTVG